MENFAQKAKAQGGNHSRLRLYVKGTEVYGGKGI